MEKWEMGHELNNEILRQLSRLAAEQVTLTIAQMARHMASTIPDGITGRQALRMFADAIEETNKETWGHDGPHS